MYECKNPNCQNCGEQLEGSQLEKTPGTPARCACCGLYCAFELPPPDGDDSRVLGGAAGGGLLGAALGGPPGLLIGAIAGAATTALRNQNVREPRDPPRIAIDDLRDRRPNSKLRAFISFAAEDSWARDMFIVQSKNDASPWELTDFSLHEAFDEKWKSKTRPRIARCDVVIQLLGQSTHQAAGALWEVNCGFQEGLPAFGIWIHRELDKRGPLPSYFLQKHVVDWKWEEIASMLNKI